MAENIYSKGTRVWFEDKDQAWMSAEVVSATKSSDDAIKLTFVDERGKVGIRQLLLFRFMTISPVGDYHQHHWERYQRRQRRPSTFTKPTPARNG